MQNISSLLALAALLVPFHSAHSIMRQPASSVSPNIHLSEFYNEDGPTPKPSTGDVSNEIFDQLTASIESDLGRQPAAAKTKKSGSRLPNSVSEGFEYKARVGKRVSTFWVIKRGEKYDLMFANNAGSKSSLSLQAEQFSFLVQAATGAVSNLRQPASDPSKCKTAFVRLHVIERSKQKREIGTCLSAKSKTDEPLKQLGNALAFSVQF